MTTRVAEKMAAGTMTHMYQYCTSNEGFEPFGPFEVVCACVFVVTGLELVFFPA